MKSGVIPEFNLVRSAVLFEAMVNRLREHKYQCRRISCPASPCTEVLSYLSKYRPKGVIVLSNCYPDIDELTWMIAREDIPVVTLASTEPISPNIIRISFDNNHMGQTAAEYIIRNGHTKVATMTCLEHLSWANERSEAFRHYCRSEPGMNVKILKMPGNVSGHVQTDLWMKMGTQLMRELLKNHPEVTAVFCINDLVAEAAIEEARRNGLNVPRDISILGCGDDSMTFGFNITTVSAEAYRTGIAAVECVMDRIKGSSKDITSAIINVHPSIINNGVTVTKYRKKDPLKE